LKKGEYVLDIGCGNGKQLVEYGKVVSPTGVVTGIDISKKLLIETRQKIKAMGLTNTIAYLFNANNPLPYPDNMFEAISCCFSIYYYKDIPAVLNEMKRVLVPGGRVFVVIPTPNNILELSSLYQTESPRIKRIETEVIPSIKTAFPNIVIDTFRNPVTFPDMDSFMDYFTATLMYKEMPVTKIKYVVDSVQYEISKYGAFTMTKEVYGVTGYKP
jgi:ubiquinone/menaquinone biosynthesis C-methylase UbiE